MFWFFIISCVSFTFVATTLKSCYSNTPGPASDNPLELSEIPDENCQINRYGHFQATITIVGKAGDEDRWGGMLDST